jgi:hypothetical protein
LRRSVSTDARIMVKDIKKHNAFERSPFINSPVDAVR